MKVVHWVMHNSSGMFHVAQSICEGEKKLGIDSHLADPFDESKWIWDGDINVSHTHIPDRVLHKLKGRPTIWVAHGDPNHVFQTSIEKVGYGQSDSWMLSQNQLRRATVCLTFFERQWRIWQSMCQLGRRVDLVTLGVDKSFWKKVESRGPYAGKPSVFTCENQYSHKWPLDLWFVWGQWIREEMPEATLHCIYTPANTHRWVYPLVNMNGTSYGSYITGDVFQPTELRNAFVSTDFFIGLVRNGDANRVSLEANASGAKTISYRDNPYSDFWIDEGDPFKYLVPQLLKIFKGETEPRQKKEVPDISVTVQEMVEIYKRL